MANPFDQFDAAPPANPFDQFDSESAYSPASLARSAQGVVESSARVRQLRDEADAEDARTRVFLGVNAPFSDRRLATFEVPAPIASFASEGIKSSPSVAAGTAAASRVTPISNRLATAAAGIPVVGGVASPVLRFGIPLVAGGIAAAGERYAQDAALPEILPAEAAALYRDTGRLAAENPTSAMLGQFAGSAPFFRPGLPLGTEGSARLTVPLISGGIGAGIEGAQQFSEGEFDPQKLAIAGVGSALMNRETGLGARIAPNLVLPQIQGRGVPGELGIMGDIMREPRLPPPTAEIPAELAAMGAARQDVSGEIAAGNMAGSEPGEIRIRRLAERMAGVVEPEQKLQILDQEVKLAGDTLTVPEQREALDLKHELQRQIDNQNALEDAAKAQQKADAEAAKAQASATQAAQEALQPPEVPKSAQILAESAKPPSIANVATEIGTQTSPFAVQNKLNELTAAPTPVADQISAPVPAADTGIVIEPKSLGPAPAEYIGRQELGDRGFDLFNLTQDIPGHPVGSTLSRETLEGYGYEVPKTPKGEPKNAVQEQIASADVQSAPRSAEQRLNDAGSDLPPISGMSRAAKRAELDAAGIKTYKGKPIDEANPAEISAAVGKLRRGELTSAGEKPGATDKLTAEIQKGIRSQRGAISPSVLAPAGGAVLGGGAGFATTEQREGESNADFQLRRLRNTALGAGIGGALGAGAILRGIASRAEAEAAAKKAPRKEGVSIPETEEGQGVRNLAKRVIEDTARPTELRQAIAENPEIIYDKFLLGELTERAAAATPEELAAMRVSGDRNQEAMAVIELANRAAAEGRDTEAADLYAQAAKKFTSSAQLLGVAKAVRSPAGFTTAIKEELKATGRAPTPEQETKLTALAKSQIKAEQDLAKAERAAREDFSPANQSAYEKAKKAAAEAGNAVADYTSQIIPKGLDDTIIQVIQGNLLTPLSQVANVYGNILFQPVRRGSMAIASGLDSLYSGVTRRGRTIDRTNPLPRLGELQAFADGTKVAAKELLTGPGADSYVKGEVQRGFRPIRSLVQGLTGKNLPVQADGSVALTDRAKKLIEAVAGAPAEVMFRLLNLGDRGFRRAAEAETLLEQGRLRGLKGRDLERFLEFPDKATQALLNTEARKAIFAQENAGVNALNHFLDSGIAKLLHLDQIPVAKAAIKIFGRLNVPFRQFPLNYVMTALNFAAPELAFAKGMYYSAKGQRRQALANIGEGIMGATMYGAAAYLWKNGLISEPTDKEAKRRSIQYDNMGGQRINISGLKRSLEGGDPTWQQGDTTIDWGRMGIPAPVFYVYTSDQAKGTKALQQTGVRPTEDTSSAGKILDRVKSYPGIGQFALDQSFMAGSAAFLEALKNGFQGPEADAWAANMFRAGSTLAVPNTVEALARANYEHIPELTGDTLGETVKNIWDFKTFQLPKDDRALLKRDMWGEPVNRTPPGTNPYLYQFVDVTKGKTQPSDPFKAALVKTFTESNNPGAYPSLPDRSMTVQGVTAKLEPRDYETLQAVTGRLRRQEAEPLVLDPEFLKIPAGERVAELEKIYSRAAADAKQELLANDEFRMKYFPEVFGGAPGARVTRRNTEARNRLENEVPEPVPTQAENPFDAFDVAPATAP